MNWNCWAIKSERVLYCSPKFSFGGNIPKIQNFIFSSLDVKFMSPKNWFWNQPIISATIGQSKNRCINFSTSIGPLLATVQKVQPCPLPSIKLPIRWLVPNELLKNLKLNSLKSIGRKLLPQKPKQFFLASVGTPKTLVNASIVLTQVSSSTLILLILSELMHFLICFEPFLNRLKNSLTVADPVDEPVVGPPLNKFLDTKKASWRRR